MLRHRLRIGRTHTGLRQQLQGDATNDDAFRVDVCDAIEVGQTHAGDDAACERCLLNQQRLRPRSTRRKRSRTACTAATTNEDVGFDGARAFSG